MMLQNARSPAVLVATHIWHRTLFLRWSLCSQLNNQKFEEAQEVLGLHEMAQEDDPMPSRDAVAQIINEHVDKLDSELWKLNQQIHKNPEIAFLEYKAHDSITSFVEIQGHDVQRQAYDMPTAFEATFGAGGRCANFSAEYDALPGIGHACGHNLIAVTAVASYLALSQALQHFSVPGRAQLLGTPAEEDGGGKIILLGRGAYRDADVSLMIHPFAEEVMEGDSFGIAGQTSNANIDLVIEFRGRSAHAAANPWDGVNALDAVVATYNNISLLRQQIMPDDRVHSSILQAPKITNAIPEYTQAKYSIRSCNLKRLKTLELQVRRCIEAAGIATGCEIVITSDLPYADIQVNQSLCASFAQELTAQGLKIMATSEERLHGSTDMGNITHAIPGLHAHIGISGPEGAFPHNHEFAAAAGTRAAHLRVLKAAKALAMTAWLALTDEIFFGKVQDDFTRGLGKR